MGVTWNGLPTVIFGSSGISKETVFLIEEINAHSPVKIFDILGFVEAEEKMIGKKVSNYEIISCDSDFKNFAAQFPILGVVLPIGYPRVKQKIYETVLKDIPNIVYPNLIHPSVSYQANTLKMGYGNIITAGVKLTTNIEIGNFNLINLNVTIGHDTRISSFCVINPLAAISGWVKINDCVLVGTGADVLQNISIGYNATVGAGAVVVKDVEAETVVFGIPAKSLQR